MARASTALLATAAALTIQGALPASAGSPVKTRLVSMTSAGEPATGGSSLAPSISASGRFVAFESLATNLPADTPTSDVYLHDRSTGNTSLVSKTSAGDAADNGSSTPSISDSGRLIAFESEATNLPGDDSFSDVYVHNRTTGRTSLVSKTSAGDPATGGDSLFASISASGRFVAFQSEATNLPGDDAVPDVYVHDRRTGRTRLVSKTSAGDPADGESSNASISASGRFIAFDCDATNLPGDASFDIYVHDRRTGKTRLVSKTSAGDPADNSSSRPSISASGRFVAFSSFATNLPGEGFGARVYVHDRETGRTKLVSKTSAGDPTSDGNSFAPSISASGRLVAFVSFATNLPGDDSISDVYVHDRETGRTGLVSQTSAGDPAAGGNSSGPSISDLGRFIAFDSAATNLPGDDSVRDIYVRGPLR